MVQFNNIAPLAIIALLVASVSSTPVPIKALDINERDINELQTRGAAGAGIKGFTTIFKFLGRLRHSKAGRVAKHASNAAGYIPQPQQQQQQRRDLSAQLSRDLYRRDILAMEERGWDYHNLGERGYFEELD